jgi:hypothetical protein
VRIARLRYDHNGLLPFFHPEELNRSPCLGRRIAFVEFHRRSDAEYFFDRYYPDISFRLEHSRGADSEPITVGITSPKNRDEVDPSRESRRDDDGWDCHNVRILLRQCEPTIANYSSVVPVITLTEPFVSNARLSALVSTIRHSVR